jgi:Flp pilus assembly protein TadD
MAHVPWLWGVAKMPAVSRAGLPRIARGRQLAVAGLALLLGACTDQASGPVTGSLLSQEPSAAPGRTDRAAPSADVERLAAAYKASPGNATAVLAYARALRITGAKAEAMAVLDKGGDKANDRTLQLERGLLALELGQTAKAEKLLRQAHDPKAPNWRLHSALGATLATAGRQQEAQAQFAKALALAPGNPAVLNNLALSYALDGKAAEAEKLLRAVKPDAVQAAQVKQNLALVVGLSGKYAEARSLAKATMPAAKADSNVAYLQDLTSAKPAAASGADLNEPGKPARKTAASLPQPTYRLGAAPAGN